MTRINTNISSLTAQQNLAMSNNQLQTTLTRLSTGLQINSGADNPSGLIAATDLGNDIATSQQAISNSQVANQMISTADSALSQISTLLDEHARPGEPGRQHGDHEPQRNRRQPVADRLLAGRHQPHIADHLVPGPKPAGRQPGLQRRARFGLRRRSKTFRSIRPTSARPPACRWTSTSMRLATQATLGATINDGLASRHQGHEHDNFRRRQLDQRDGTFVRNDLQ